MLNEIVELVPTDASETVMRARCSCAVPESGNSIIVRIRRYTPTTEEQPILILCYFDRLIMMLITTSPIPKISSIQALTSLDVLVKKEKSA
jgi:hypothetical protein